MDRLVELLGEGLERERTRLTDEPDQHGKTPLHHLEVGLHEVDDPRPADLHRDRPPLVLRTIDLAEARPRDGVRIERVEHPVDGAELVFDHRAGLGPLGGRHLVLELREFGDVLAGEDVGPCREDLAEFDEGRAEGEQRVQQDPRAFGSHLARDRS